MRQLLLAAKMVPLLSPTQTAPLWKQVASNPLSPWKQFQSVCIPVLSDFWKGLWLAVPKSKVSRARKRNRTKDRVQKPLQSWYICGEYSMV